MMHRKYIFLLAMVLIATPALRGQTTESSINKQLQALRATPGPPGAPPDASKSTAIPDVQRPAAIVQNS